jgi:glycolate oxidase
MLADGVMPAAMELIDAECLRALEGHRDTTSRRGLDGALLLVEVDGLPTAIEEEIARVSQACWAHGAPDVQQAQTESERDRLWDERRGLSLALRAMAPRKINHDVVVPRGKIRDLFELIDQLRASADLPMPSFGHVGDGNIHVNILVDPADRDALRRATQAERQLFEGVVSLGGSISGEHGIGFAKAPFIGLELSPDTIALMQQIKQVFDPNGILNPGKIFPESLPDPDRR